MSGLLGVFCVVLAACAGPSTSPSASSGTSSSSDLPEETPTTAASEWVRPSVTLAEEETGIQPGESIQDAVDAAAEGEIIEIAAGIHRLQSVQPKTGQTIRGAPGAVISGAMLLDDFALDGDVWRQGGVSFEGDQTGVCSTEESTCKLPEELYFDGQLLTRVADSGQVDGDSWFLDYESDTVVLGRDPGDAEVELAVLPFAFGGEATDVTIEGLVIEKYASPAQRGAINAGRSWTIVGNEIRHNHGAGLYPGSDSLVTDNYFHHNGQMAIDGGGVDSTYERNEIAYNNFEGDFSFEWGAGGVKFVHTTNLVLRDNYVHNNRGPGLWIDGYNENTLFEGNRVVGNLDVGIKVEISGSATVVDNVVVGNGFGNEFPPRGAGILVRESGPVEISGNRLEGNKEAIILHHDEDRTNETGNFLHDVHVHDNEVVLDGGHVGYFGDLPADAFAGSNLVFEDNQYVGSPNEAYFLDHGDEVRFERWQELGRDTGSTITDPDA